MGLLILGTGGHAKVALDIALESGIEVAGFLDDDQARHGQMIHGYKIHGPTNQWKQFGDALFPAIGSNQSRKNVVQSVDPNAPWQTLIHPKATVSRFALVGSGVLVALGACIGPDARIGDFAIINTSSSVDHDCEIGTYAHIAVGAHLAGNVHIGEGAFLGAGAIVIPGLEIGDWSLVGAGATVIRPVQSNQTVIGTPAKPK
ncbi:MAG: acetyltransferase [Fimbriimonadaceae bacterium]